MRYLPLLLFLVVSGCASLVTYPPDTYSLTDHALVNESVGFYGYGLKIPEGYEGAPAEPLGEEAKGYRNLVDWELNTYDYNEGADFHFHQPFVFNRRNIWVVLQPVVVEWVRWGNLPLDQEIGAMTLFVNRMMFYKTGERGYSRETEVLSPERRAVITISNENTSEDFAHEQYLLAGDLNELYMVTVFGPPDQQKTVDLIGREFLKNLHIFSSDKERQLFQAVFLPPSPQEDAPTLEEDARPALRPEDTVTL